MTRLLGRVLHWHSFEACGLVLRKFFYHALHTSYLPQVWYHALCNFLSIESYFRKSGKRLLHDTYQLLATSAVKLSNPALSASCHVMFCLGFGMVSLCAPKKSPISWNSPIQPCQQVARRKASPALCGGSTRPPATQSGVISIEDLQKNYYLLVSQVLLGGTWRSLKLLCWSFS